MGCDGEHSTPAPVPRAPPMITVTVMATALAAHTPDDDNTGCDGIPPPAPRTLGATTTTQVVTEGIPYQRRSGAHPDDDDEMSHDGGSTPAPSPHPCCPLLRVPSTTTMKSNPAVAAPSHAAQRRQQRPPEPPAPRRQWQRAGGSDGDGDAAAAALNPVL
ncbi:hypothetical protein EDB89DRAFT_2230189 [Lactarius sanguifluus]|nr:hypothetical protein EDB89DRAFT_2230189 [Lactarius sanguifluus]